MNIDKHNMYYTNHEDYLYYSEASRLDYNYEISDYWALDNLSFKGLDFPVINYHYDYKSSFTKYIYRSSNGLIKLMANNTSMGVHIYASTRDSAHNLLIGIKSLYPPSRNEDDGLINVRFWYSGPAGPVSITRKIEVPKWEDIAVNYNYGTRVNLERLISKFKPSHGGQVILWHGHPGTGKTYALRSLAERWKEWCSAEYILDPEILFGGSPHYLTSLVLGEEEEIWDRVSNEYTPSDKDQWKLLIMEDTGELISEDAKERTGQGLSRLLNLADGIIGQGLKVLILITTNEPIEKLHPAVARPGRCAAVVEFEPLGPDAIREWCKTNNFDMKFSNRNMHLADLYAMKEEFEVKDSIESATKKSLGFRVTEVA